MRARGWIAAALLAMLTAGCGGGTKTSSQASLPDQKSLAFESSGLTIERGSQVELTARLSNRSGGNTSPIAGARVEFSTDAGALSPANGSVLTDSEGRARVMLSATAATGAYAVTVKAPEHSAEASGNVQITVGGDANSYPRVELVVEGGYTLTAGEPTAVRAYVADGADDTPMEGVPVTFGGDGATFEPSLPIVATNSAGVAEAVMIPQFVPGVHTLTATIDIEGAPNTATALFTTTVPAVQLVLAAAGDTTIAAGDSLPIDIVASSAVDLPALVELTSSCVEMDKATVTEAVSLIDNLGQAIYRSEDCRGSDTIVAQAMVDGVEIGNQASLTVQILAPEATGIAFGENNATAISIAGLENPALPDSAVLEVLVTDSFGDPAPSKEVAFELLAPTFSGVSLTARTDITDGDGLASVGIVGGLVPSAPRVRATVVETGASATSPAILVTTGIPDQDSLSVSAETLNIEGWAIDGVETILTARLADHYNNPVADGTPVLFRTEGGAVQAGCVTQAGACSVTLHSQSPRPSNGRVTVTVHTPGDESFDDLNGSGLRDNGEPFTDLGEPFQDFNENGVRDPDEPIVDTDQSGTYSPANGVYDGLLCSSGCGSAQAIDVRDDVVVVFSTSNAQILIEPASVDVDQVSTVDVIVRIWDLNGNHMPAGSEVSIRATNGELGAEVGDLEIPNTNAPGPYVLNIPVTGDGEASAGTLTVTVVTPSGARTSASIPVTDTLNCDVEPTPEGCAEG